MITKVKKISEMTTILKVVLCFLLIVSCSKFEEEPKQTTLIPNINEAQAYIGGENWFENYVNIEDFKGVQVEDNITYQKHQKALQKLLSYDKFPNGKTKEDLENISRRIYYSCSYDAEKNIEWYHLGISYREQLDKNSPYEYERVIDKNLELKPFVKIYFRVENNNEKLTVLTPKEVYELPINEREKAKEFYWFLQKDGLYFEYCSLEYYSRYTGIPKEDFKDLRIISKPVNSTYEKEDKMLYFYQMPYKDNYKDYQNDTKTVYNVDELRQFIKKGSFIFIFDRPLYELSGRKHFGEYWGHMMIVGDWYCREDLNDYKSLKLYGKIPDSKDERITHIKYSSSYFLSEYLKHFVFIEAQRKNVHNQNKEQGFERDSGVMLTSGNDERFQEYLDNATCIAVVNINDGYQMSHPDLIDNMLSFANRQLGKPYNLFPNILETEADRQYCSGLVYYSFLNNYKNPSLKLVLTKHAASLTSVSDWIMPRTICNSPFVYTRVWYKRE